jgi:alkaline phosphatase
VGEMTTKAVDLLSDSDQAGKKGFFLQVEGALIDKRSHANDAGQVLEEMKAFDDAVAAARAFAEKDGNTLVIVTADHECAGFGIVEKGTYTNAEATIRPSNTDSGNPANNSTPSQPTFPNPKDPARSTGPINGSGSGDNKNFAPATFRTPDDPSAVTDGSTAASLWLSYLSGNHTGADVNIYTFGPQASMFGGKEDNTDIYGRMKSALGLG